LGCIGEAGSGIALNVSKLAVLDVRDCVHIYSPINVRVNLPVRGRFLYQLGAQLFGIELEDLDPLGVSVIPCNDRLELAFVTAMYEPFGLQAVGMV
jgi:hypothetical protein